MTGRIRDKISTGLQKDVRISWNTMIPGFFNYIMAVAPFFIPVINSQDPAYMLSAASVAVIGATASSITLSDKKNQESLKEEFNKLSKSAWNKAWELVLNQDRYRKLRILSSAKVKLKDLSYEKVFQWNESESTAAFVQSRMTVDGIRNQVLSVLREQVVVDQYDSENQQMEEMLNAFAADITATLFSRLNDCITERKELHKYLDFSEIKKKRAEYESMLAGFQTVLAEHGTILEDHGRSLSEYGTMLDVHEKRIVANEEILASQEKSLSVQGKQIDDLKNKIIEYGNFYVDSDWKNAFALLKDNYSQKKQEEMDRIKRMEFASVLRRNSIRRLAEDLWVNWKTGVLAVDLNTALTGKRDSEGYICILDPSLLRLLSILVQGEGAVVNAKELDLRRKVKISLPDRAYRKNEKTSRDRRYGIDADRPKTLFPEMGNEDSWYDYAEESVKTAVEKLCSVSDRLEAIIKEVRMMKESGTEKGSVTGYRIELYDGGLNGDVDHSNSDESDSYENCYEDGDEDSYYEDEDSSASCYSEENNLGQHDSDKNDFVTGYDIYTDYYQYCYADDAETDGFSGDDRSLATDHIWNRDNGAYKDPVALLAKGDMGVLKEAYADEKRIEDDDYSEAWFRAYYSQSCRKFETDSMNTGNKGDDVKGIFGNYEMAKVYQNAYAAVEKSGNPNPKKTEDRWSDPKNYYHKNTAVMLDYVESWFKQTAYPYGRVLVIHGQPGDGKTTFCKKAVYAHVKEGWLSGVRHVVRFSLNPVDNDQKILNNGLDLKEALCFRPMESSYVLRIKPEVLNNSLVIFDGYDELSSALSNGTIEGAFIKFCEEAEKIANDYHFKVIITSRTMCITDAIMNDSVKNHVGIPVVSFAPLTEQQQDAMLNRMIELDPEESNDGMLSEEETDKSEGNGEKQARDSMMNHWISLKKYRDECLPELRSRKNENLNELMRIPSLFRMIVTQRFREYKTKTQAELYMKLFHGLLAYKYNSENAFRDHEGTLYDIFERIAARIFLCNDDTCRFFGKKMTKDKEHRESFYETIYRNKELLHVFLTKDDSKREGHVGFLHRSFYQYFLARFMISAIKNSKEVYSEPHHAIGSYFPQPKKNTGGPEEPEMIEPDLIDLLTILRVRPIKDLDMWKMVAQVAELEQNFESRVPEELRNSHVPLEQNHIKTALSWLENERNAASLLNTVEGIAEECYSSEKPENPDGFDEPKEGLRAAENVVFNLIGVLAAAEQGRCWNMKPEDYWKQSIRFGGSGNGLDRGYPNICRLLCRGQFAEIYLACLNLSGCDLKNARFQRAVFADVISRTTEHTESRMTLRGEGADLSNADLSGANLSGANLSRVRLDNARLYDTNLHDADLTGAHLDGVNPDSEKAEKADAGNETLTEKTRGGRVGETNEAGSIKDAARNSETHAGTDMSNATLTGAVLKGASLRRANLWEARLEGADLTDAHLTGANLFGATLVKATLKDTDFKGAILSCADFGGVNREGALGLPKMKYNGILKIQVNGTTQIINLLKENRIPFGRYPKKDNDRMYESKYKPWEPLYWRVLKREYDKILLITEDLVECRKYHEECTNVTWETCSLRKWMNEEFIYTAFNNEEDRSRIALVLNQNPDYDYYEVLAEGEDPTWDRVFALSIDEVRRYFKNDSDRMAAPTPYVEKAYEGRVYISDEYKVNGRGTGWWWLRSPAIFSSHAALVEIDGGVAELGGGVDHSGASVRPALWLNL